MYEVSKGFNFRFTVGEIKILDDVKAELQKSRIGFSSWRRLTRTDVIKMLIRREWATILQKYEDEKCQSEKKLKANTKRPIKTYKNQKKRTKTATPA